MKKLMFAVIACAMGLSGCSSEDDCATNPEPAGDVTEIKLSADRKSTRLNSSHHA